MKAVRTYQIYSDLVFVVQRLEDPVEHCAWGLWTHGEMTSCLCFVRWHTHTHRCNMSSTSPVSLFFPSGASEGRPDCVWEVPARAWRCTKSAGTAQLLQLTYAIKQMAPVHTELKLSFQNLFGKMADVLEKIKKWVNKIAKFKNFLGIKLHLVYIHAYNSECRHMVCPYPISFLPFLSLFMWVQPESTRKLYICLWVAFISSCVLPYKLMGFMIGEDINEPRQSFFIPLTYCTPWIGPRKNAHAYTQSSAHKQMHSYVTCVTVLRLLVRGSCRLLACRSGFFLNIFW